MKSAVLLSISVVVVFWGRSSCLAAPSSRVTTMENEQVLDANSQIFLRWTVINGTGDIEMELQVKCTGWIGISFAVGELGVPGAQGDIIMGGYNDELGVGYIEDRWIDLGVPVPSNGGDLDESIDVILKSAKYTYPWTIIRLSRSIFTGDSQDLPIVAGPMVVGWTFASSDDTSIPHDIADTGFAQVTFY